MSTGPRLTPQTIAVLQVFLEHPEHPRYGLDLARAAGLKTGTLHPILARLQQAGWVDSFWEPAEQHEDAGRPRRRYYRFTSSGAETARHAISGAAQSTGGSTLGRLRPQPGH